MLGALLSSASVMSKQVSWFESNSPLTQAHRHLLNNDLSGMFSSLVEVWQLEKNSSIAPHLNDFSSSASNKVTAISITIT